MITEEEKQEIIDKAVEKTLLLIPEVVGNMIANQMAFKKLSDKFYGDYPEFKDHKKVVASVVEEIDGKNTFLEIEKKFEMAIPKIRERILTMKNLDTTKVEKPKLNYDNGEI